MGGSVEVSSWAWSFVRSVQHPTTKKKRVFTENFPSSVLTATEESAGHQPFGQIAVHTPGHCVVMSILQRGL